MPATVLQRSSAHPKQTSVLRGGDRGGHRPTDPLVRAFEGVMEGLVACGDDRAALVETIDHLAQMRLMENRIVDHLQHRIRRLAGAVEPELREIAAATDAVLSERTRLRRSV